jgi:outer membrane protein TolC
MVDKSVAEREKILSLIRKLYDRGARSLFDVSRAETDVEAARLQRLSVETQLRSQQKSLLAAMGTPEDPWQGLSDALSAKIVRVSRDSAIRLALEDRPEVRGEKALVSINENLAKIARAGHLPSIGLTGAYSLDRFSNNGFVSRSNSWSGAVTASLDIFSGFSVQAGYNKAMAALKTEQENLKARQQSVILDVESDMIALEQSAARIEIAKTLHDRARKSEGLAKAEYEGGRGSLLDLISAQDSLLNAETGLIDALADHHEAQARIEQAVGAPLSEFVKE